MFDYYSYYYEREADEDLEAIENYKTWNVYFPIISIIVLLAVYTICYNSTRRTRQNKPNIIHLQHNNCRCTAKYCNI